MSNKLIPFNFEAKEIRVVTDKNNQPWFVAKDVCDILEIQRTSDAVNKLDPDEKGTEEIRTLGGQQEVLVINESGLYTLIIRSNKPKAKPFRKWVTSVVLPSIRKTGSYSINQDPALSPSPNDQPIIDVLPEPEPITALVSVVPPSPEAYIKSNSKQIKENVRDLKAIAKDLLNLEGNQLILSVNTAIRRIHKVDLLEVLNNQTNAPNHLVSDVKASHFAVKDLADRFSISAIKFNQLLLQQGFQIETRNNKNKLVWQPTEKGKPHCEMTDVSRLHSEGTSQQLRWYETILEVLVLEAPTTEAKAKAKTTTTKKLKPSEPQETFLN